MSRDGLNTTLSKLLADVTGAPLDTLGPRSTRTNTPGWDSVASLGFIVAVEEQFGVAILTSEALLVHSLDDMAQLLDKKGIVA
jgi:acyl carrier protein